MVYFEQITRQNTDITGIKNCVSSPSYQILEFFVCSSAYFFIVSIAFDFMVDIFYSFFGRIKDSLRSIERKNRVDFFRRTADGPEDDVILFLDSCIGHLIVHS